MTTVMYKQGTIYNTLDMHHFRILTCVLMSIAAIMTITNTSVYGGGGEGGDPITSRTDFVDLM
jgi:hypothetical protein